MADTALQRKNMVESQVRPSDVTDRRITAAMMQIARERFVPAALSPLAYMDEAITVAPGATLLAPRVFARLAQLADIADGDRVLVIGGASGYAAAVLARLSRDVVVLCPSAEGQTSAQEILKALGVANVRAETGVLADGFVAGAPYDVIFIEGTVEVVPDALVAQLADGGRLVAVQQQGGLGRALVLGRTGSGTSRKLSFEVSAPRLAGFDAVGSRFSF